MLARPRRIGLDGRQRDHGAGSDAARGLRWFATASSRMPFARLLRAPRASRLIATSLLGLALAVPEARAQPAAADPGPALMLAQVPTIEDNPGAALRQAAEAAAASGQAAQRFWLLLVQARALALLESGPAAVAKTAEARTLLDDLGPGRATGQRWLALAELGNAIYVEDSAAVLARTTSLRVQGRRDGDAALACEAQSLELWLLLDARSLDEAWLAAEAVERCAQDSGLAYLRPVALATMGNIVGEMPGELRQGRRGTDFVARALAALGPQGMRFRRSILEWDLARLHIDGRDWDAALTHLKRALALSQDLGDDAGIGAAHTELARVQLERREPTAALAELAQAERHLAGHDAGSRRIAVATLRIRALTALGRPEVLAAIDAARRWDIAQLQPLTRARLARAMSEGYAAQQRWREAYAEGRRAAELEGEGRAGAADIQALRLQARYDGVRREAETAELRHREESARLALQAREARQRALLAAVALLAVVLAGAGAALWALLRRRRVLADLALKDELTGAPNRRAVGAYAAAQLRQTRSLGVPLSVALVDFDHFKQINDRYGHAGGDALLRGFAAAAQRVLRGQDRVGRWGGEEWLLVMPGTPLEELPLVDARLRRALADTVVPGLPQPHGCTFSMGAAQSGPGLDSLERLLEEADRCLYRAKAEGRDRLVLAAGAAAEAAQPAVVNSVSTPV
jgi:diguanylate cyclase (GGDEF)-like protein